MAGKLIVDTIETEATFLRLNVSNTLIATMNTSGIFSGTGTRMIGSDGTLGISTISGSAILPGTITGNLLSANCVSGNNIVSGVALTGNVSVTGNVTVGAGTASNAAISTTGDPNTGIFFPAADTIAFAEGGAEAMRIDSSGNVGIGTSSPVNYSAYKGLTVADTTGGFVHLRNTANSHQAELGLNGGTGAAYLATYTSTPIQFLTNNAERMRIDSSGNVGIGTSSPGSKLNVDGTIQIGAAGSAADVGITKIATRNIRFDSAPTTGTGITVNVGTDANQNSTFIVNGNVGIGTSSPSSKLTVSGGSVFASGANRGVVLGEDQCVILGDSASAGSANMLFYTANAERARITSGGDLCVGTTTSGGHRLRVNLGGGAPLGVDRTNDDGNLVVFYQDSTLEGTISVSGATVSYNAFAGSHWSQLQQGRGYNPEILRGTVMSSIGEMCEWKSVEWTETIEHPAVPAVDAKDAVLDEEGNVIEPAVEAVEGKDAWTETIPHREAYLGNLAVGATFTEDGVTKTVVDDGNERLPKVKISDVVGDKAVYGVFQTWDEVQDMLVTSLGAFVVRIAAGVTVQIGDLLESNGDGCAKVQDDDVIRSKTIGKVTSITPSATYADGSYTVPAVLYCG